MNNLLNARYIFIANTLPQLLLAFLLGSQYTLIHSQLSPASIQYWAVLGPVLAVLIVANAFYATWKVRRGENVPVIYGLLVLVAYVGYLFAFYSNLDELIPSQIPRWIVSDDFYFYTGSFIMPALVHAVFVLVAGLTNMENNPKAWKSFLGAVSIPAVIYVFSQIAEPFWRSVDSRLGTVTVLVFFVAVTTVFLFLLLRTIYIITLNKAGLLAKYKLLWLVPVAIILPVLGLLLNNGLLIKKFDIGKELFGDFSSPWFYILAVVNGVLVCLPATGNKQYRLVLFAARCVTLVFTTYFFIVFLPYLPLSIVAVLAAGLGFLMLAPTLLMVAQVVIVWADYTYLKNHFSNKWLPVVAVTGFMVLPAMVTFNYLHHRSVLHQALNYVYSAEYTATSRVDTASLSATLTTIYTEKDQGRRNFMSRKLPYLSAYFNWLVLDNMVLSDAKITMLQRVFTGKADDLWRAGRILPDDTDVELTDVKANSTYNSSTQAWVSTIDITLTDQGRSGRRSEYATTFELPDGCWISDYYLYIDSVKEHGLLAEKKAALWVYNQITTIERRDPGILYYLTGNKVNFRVYPFEDKQVRYTGIEFIHKEPVTLTIDGHAVTLGDTLAAAPTTPVSINRGATVYVPVAYKNTLPHITRKPYYHFVVDASVGQGKNKGRFISRIEKELSSNRLDKEGARVSFVNSSVSTYDLKAGLAQPYSQQQFTGGFYLDRAVKNILYNSYTQPDNTFPVIVVVCDSFDKAIIENDFADFKMVYPDGELFYQLNADGQLQGHRLFDNPYAETGLVNTFNFSPYVLAYPNSAKAVAYLADNHQPALIQTGAAEKTDAAELQEKDWNAALKLQGDWLTQVLHPSVTETRWPDMVRNSFATRIMTPATSYIVVENEMQKEALRRKQQQVLSGKKELDLEEDVKHGSEPEEWVVIVLLMGAIVWLQKSNKLFSKSAY